MVQQLLIEILTRIPIYNFLIISWNTIIVLYLKIILHEIFTVAISLHQINNLIKINK